MNEFWRRIVSLLVVVSLAFGTLTVLPGCREEGPGEEAGERLDEAAEEAGEAVEEAGEAVQGSAK